MFMPTKERTFVYQEELPISAKTGPQELGVRGRFHMPPASAVQILKLKIVSSSDSIYVHICNLSMRNFYVLYY